jgi:hypothetical protein
MPRPRARRSDRRLTAADANLLATDLGLGEATRDILIGPEDGGTVTYRGF